MLYMVNKDVYIKLNATKLNQIKVGV